jgi:hypothetical protein
LAPFLEAPFLETSQRSPQSQNRNHIRFAQLAAHLGGMSAERMQAACEVHPVHVIMAFNASPKSLLFTD